MGILIAWIALSLVLSLFVPLKFKTGGTVTYLSGIATAPIWFLLLPVVSILALLWLALFIVFVPI